MPKLTIAVPSYRLHKNSGQAIVTLNGTDHYLGLWQSEASRAKYDRLIREWIAAGRTTAQPAQPPGVTVAELLLPFLHEAEVAYRKNGKPTSHLHNIHDAVVPLSEMYGQATTADFGPLKLKAVREVFVQRRLCRSTINKHIGTIKRVHYCPVEQLAKVHLAPLNADYSQHPGP